jgi:HEAT repeat protein
MRFEPLSFILGFFSATVISLFVWLSRRRLRTIQESAETQIEGTRELLGKAADKRYAQEMLRYLQHRHVAGSLFGLTDVLLEPRLIAPPLPLALPDDEGDETRDVFDVVPLFHDMPQSYAPFNIETITLDDLGAGDRHVALLGVSGMGKSTALTALALMALGIVRFETLEGMTEQAIEEEEKGLSEDDRRRRAEERERIQEQALKKLHTAHEKKKEQLGEAVERENLPPIDIPGLVPILVDVNDIEFDMAAYGKRETLDPTEPLVHAVQRQVSAVTAQVTGSVLYPALEQGKALILLDGYDDLAPHSREVYFYWLQQLLELYGHNMIVIAGPVTGYESLVTLGFTPAYLRAWRPDDYELLAAHWSEAWRAHDPKAKPPDEQTIRRITADNQGRTMLDVTLKIWSGLADDVREAGRPGWYDSLINRRLSMPDARSALPVVAAKMLDAGQPLDRAALEEVLPQAITTDPSKKAAKPEDMLDTLVRDGLLVPYAGNRFGLAHSQITSYLASETLAQLDLDEVDDLALNPAWQDALSFAAAHINMLTVVQHKLSAPPDLMYSDLFGLVQWLPDAPPDAIWRGEVFKRLAAALMAPDQYPAVRERAMAALIATRDRNIVFILRQALRATDPDTRRLGCIGLGALGNIETVNDLASLLGDEDRDVKLAAALALGAIGTDQAIEVMLRGLFQENHEVRRAIAEALAAIPDEGHKILRDGITTQEIEIRRAAVYGLSRIREPWALVALYHAMLEDAEWYVRTAAEEAFLAAQSPEKDGPHAHPEADSLGWLVQWAAERGQGVPAGPNARQVLIRVLQEGQPVHKVMAACTLGRLGHVLALKPLYAALRDRDASVRSAAYAALSDLQLRLGQPLPAVI